MMKDQVPVSGNSSDKRRPLIMVSPGERQGKTNKRKPIPDLNLQIEELQLELDTYKSSNCFTEKDALSMVSSSVAKLKEEHKKEIAKLNRELDKKDKKIQELTQQLSNGTTTEG